MTELRKEVIKAMKNYRDYLKPDNRGWKCLEVGIDGDERPSGNYKYFGKGNEWKTLDNTPSLKPDIVADITDTKLPDSEWDLIICSQTIEHIFEFRKAFNEIARLLKVDGHAIIDCPFYFPYHGEHGFNDFWRMSDVALGMLAKEVGLGIVDYGMVNSLATGLFKKYES